MAGTDQKSSMAFRGKTGPRSVPQACPERPVPRGALERASLRGVDNAGQAAEGFFLRLLPSPPAAEFFPTFAASAPAGLVAASVELGFFSASAAFL